MNSGDLAVPSKVTSSTAVSASEWNTAFVAPACCAVPAMRARATQNPRQAFCSRLFMGVSLPPSATTTSLSLRSLINETLRRRAQPDSSTSREHASAAISFTSQTDPHGGEVVLPQPREQRALRDRGPRTPPRRVWARGVQAISRAHQRISARGYLRRKDVYREKRLSPEQPPSRAAFLSASESLKALFFVRFSFAAPLRHALRPALSAHRAQRVANDQTRWDTDAQASCTIRRPLNCPGQS